MICTSHPFVHRRKTPMRWGDPWSYSFIEAFGWTTAAAVSAAGQWCDKGMGISRGAEYVPSMRITNRTLWPWKDRNGNQSDGMVRDAITTVSYLFAANSNGFTSKVDVKDFNQKKQHSANFPPVFHGSPKKTHTTPQPLLVSLISWFFSPWILRMAATDFQRKLDEASKRKNGVSAYRMEVAPESMQLLRSLATWNQWGLGLWGDGWPWMAMVGFFSLDFFLIPKLVPPGKTVPQLLR